MSGLNCLVLITMPHRFLTNKSLADILQRYRRLMGDVDVWFNTCLDAGGENLSCRSGCSGCCKALFDISLLDAWTLREEFNRLPVSVREQVKARCAPRLTELKRRWPQLTPPYILNDLPEEEWTDMPEDDQESCPLLDQEGRCLVYASRPMICRLHGLPHIDINGEDFSGVVCSLHRTDPEKILPEDVVRWHFRETFEAEVALMREFAFELTGGEETYLDTFIPLALLADYEAVDWLHFKPGLSAGL